MKSTLKLAKQALPRIMGISPITHKPFTERDRLQYGWMKNEKDFDLKFMSLNTDIDVFNKVKGEFLEFKRLNPNLSEKPKWEKPLELVKAIRSAQKELESLGSSGDLPEPVEKIIKSIEIDAAQFVEQSILLDQIMNGLIDIKDAIPHDGIKATYASKITKKENQK